MKRILFVDDEPRVLSGLERSLYAFDTDWEMEFVDSGAKALERMAQAPFDVVVSDMRMPGMNGAELLAKVMALYPHTVRLILSGHADNELVLKCVGSTHQYLSKPCDPEALKATIERATSLESTLKNERLRQLASRMERLPSLPSLYCEIVETLKSPEVPLEDVAALIAKDIGMTAKLLKLVNSAFFGLSRQLSDPLEAVSYLGLDTVKSLILTTHTFSQYRLSPDCGFTLDELWRHSAQTANAAKAIAEAEKTPANVAGEAFSAGLLHDTGKLVLAGNFAAEYGQVAQLLKTGSLPRLAAECQVFGATHAEVGGYLLGLWGLPVPVVEAITLHHEPSRCSTRGFTPLLAVHAANLLAKLPAPTPDRFPPPELDLQYLEACGLKHRLDAWQDAVHRALSAEELV